MKFTFQVGGLPFNGETILTKSMGGSESAGYYVTKELAARGHDITVWTNSEDEGTWNNVRYRWSGGSSQDCPLGVTFHEHATKHPTDVMVIQRHPRAFQWEWNSKVNLWWIHDLTTANSQRAILSQMWNVDAVMPVSEFHKQQFMGMIGSHPDYVRPLYNGIDAELYSGEITTPLALKLQEFPDHRKLLYVSRPERGLENLVKPNGVMEQLLKIAPDTHLYVCGYENRVIPDEFVNWYNALWVRIANLPNCTNIGALNKKELADMQRVCDAWAYPSTFEETSCISAMEFMAAGASIIGSVQGAIPETAKGYKGATLIPIKKDGTLNIKRFVKEFAKLDGSRHDPFVPHTWHRSVDMLEETVEHVLRLKRRNPTSVANHYMHYSDIWALRKQFDDPKVPEQNPMLARINDELHDKYGFVINDTYREHYRQIYQWLNENEGTFGPENILTNDRFIAVEKLIRKVKAGGVVLDYGSAHGHYCMNLAKMHPDKTFIGIDFVEENKRVFEKWAKDYGVSNARFVLADANDDFDTIYKKAIRKPVDCIMVNEVLEHVSEPAKMLDGLTAHLKSSGFLIGTLPAGPWEAQTYDKNPWRCHIHHFDRDDLEEVWGHHPNFQLEYLHAGRQWLGEHIANYVMSFNKPTEPSRSIDYQRKFKMLAPRETLSLCMIVRDGESTLRQCLESAHLVVNELIIGVDEKTVDRTVQVIENFAADHPEINVRHFSIPSPTEIGFAAARNLTLEDVSCDWILWLDADEVLTYPEVLSRYLRNNQFNAYSIKQHHFSLRDPLGVLKTDTPTKVFRANRGITFYGLIHEHPEVALNMTTGKSITLNYVEIAHTGYWNEKMREEKFRERNLELLVRDREENPERILGKYLWLRDLAQMCTNELKKNGEIVTDAMKKRAQIGISTWEELLDMHQVRMAVDGLPFYSTLVRLNGGGIDYAFESDAAQWGGIINKDSHEKIHGTFASREHIAKLLKEIFDVQTRQFGTRYS